VVAGAWSLVLCVFGSERPHAVSHYAHDHFGFRGSALVAVALEGSGRRHPPRLGSTAVKPRVISVTSRRRAAGPICSADVRVPYGSSYWRTGDYKNTSGCSGTICAKTRTPGRTELLAAKFMGSWRSGPAGTGHRNKMTHRDWEQTKRNNTLTPRRWTRR